MDIAIVYLFSLALLARVAIRTQQTPGEMARAILAQTLLATVYITLEGCAAAFARAGQHFSFIEIIADGANGMTAAFGIMVIQYIHSGKWNKSLLALGLLALIPGYGRIVAAVLWIAIPWRARALSRSSRADVRAHIVVQTLLVGTLSGGILTLATAISDHILISIIGPVISVVFLHAGLHAQKDPENELSYLKIARLVKNGIVTLIPISVLPVAILHPENFLVLERFLIPAAIVAAAIFIVILYFRFTARGIRTFLGLYLVSLVPTAFAFLYAERIDPTLLPGLRLVSRIFTVLAALFILRQYLRWGFQIIQTMVMIITAIATAAVVFFVLIVMHPYPAQTAIEHNEIIRGGTLLLDLVILSALPPVFINYSLGTMKVTWALLSFGIFLDAYTDFLPVRQSIEGHISATMSAMMIALAFAVLWRYTSAMMRDIDAVSRRLGFE